MNTVLFVNATIGFSEKPFSSYLFYYTIMLREHSKQKVGKNSLFMK